MANLREREPREEEGGLDGAPEAKSSYWEGSLQRNLWKRGLRGGRGKVVRPWKSMRKEDMKKEGVVSRVGCCPEVRQDDAEKWPFWFISMESWLTLENMQAGSSEGDSWAAGA